MRKALLVGVLVLALAGPAQARPLRSPIWSIVVNAGSSIALRNPGNYAVVEVPDHCPRPRLGFYLCAVDIKYWTAPHTPAYCSAGILAWRHNWRLVDRMTTCPWAHTLNVIPSSAH